MARGIRIGNQHGWLSEPLLVFGINQPTTVNLATYVYNPKNKTLVYAVAPGYALPSGASLSGSIVTWAGTGTSGTTPVKFTITFGGVTQTTPLATTIVLLPDTTPPSTPLNPAATAISSSQINFSWSAATDPVVVGATTSGVANYRPRRNGVALPVVAGTSLQDTGLTSSTLYTYTVAAVDVSGNESAQSASASATTQAAAGGNTINALNATEAEVQAAINQAVAGDTVQVPAGTATWNALQLNKAIALIGAGIGQTNITLGAGNTITKQAVAITRMRGFTFTKSGGGNASHGFVVQGAWTTAEPIVIEDCRFDVSSSGLFRVAIPGGLIVAKCIFNALWDDSLLQCKLPGDLESWQSSDTLGNRDTNGKLNIYVEDCYFRGGANQATDFDDASRAVFRYNRMDYSSFNSHGLDTSETGVRHWEIYGNQFRNVSAGGHTGGTGQSDLSNQNWAIWIRGATGVIYNNVIDDIANSFWGFGKSEGKFDIRAQQDNSGSSYGYFTDGRAKYSAGQGAYPRQNQLALNWSNSLTNSVGINGGVGDYFIDPIYIWGNTGAGTTAGGLLGFANGGSWGSQDGYFVQGRDYFNGGSAKPGYTAYTYPHPLRVTSGQAY